MSDYLVVGKKGTGKSKLAVQKIHLDYLSKGKRVATNIDLFLENMCNPMSRATVIRLPDKPLLEDLEMVGVGNDQVDEELNGGLFLDECATWLNARTFNDKGRTGFIDFCVHGRKLGWDMWLLAQNMGQIDKQVREALLEYVVRCTRLDKVKIPMVGGLLQVLTFGKLGKMKFHYASTRLIEMPDVKIDGEYYKATFYQNCYNTRQKFREWVRDPKDPRFKDEIFVGPYSMLSAWHLKGRHLKAQKRSIFETIIAAILCIDSPRVSPSAPRHPAIEHIAKNPRISPDDAWRLAKRIAEADRHALA